MYMLVLVWMDPSRTAQGMQLREPSYSNGAAGSTLERPSQLTGQLLCLLLDLDPFPFVLFLGSLQLVRGGGGREYRHLDGVRAFQVGRDVPHSPVHQVGQLPQAAAFAVTADVVGATEDVDVDRRRALFHVRPASHSSALAVFQGSQCQEFIAGCGRRIARL